MNAETTRRGFLRNVAATTGLLIACPPEHRAHAAEPDERDVGAAADSPWGNVVVVRQNVSRDTNPRAPSWCYVTEILRRAGLFFQQLSPADLSTLPGKARRIIVLAGDLRLSPEQRECFAQLVAAGSSLVGIGGTSGLDSLFGVASQRPLAEGWMKAIVPTHPVLAGLRSSLHVFGGCAVTASSATVLADIDTGKQGAKGSAIVENRCGAGHTLLLAPDLVFSVVHIQQGVPVLQDGVAAPDGSAELDDGELKAEDGLVLDWQRDRTPLEPDGKSVFLEPITDELREIILRSVFYVARRQGSRVPLIWYWPRGLKAIGHVSHDTDGNDPQKAVALLAVMNRCNVKSTWCTLYPGGYPKEFYETLKQQGFEIAMHYDARTGGRDTSWSKEHFLLQHRWLMQEAGLDRITSNKNHYTRWEGRLDFLRWCEEVGITCDQTRGPSKAGTIGFPLGGSQPYFALDDEGPTPRILNVLQVNMLTQDLVVVCPAEYGTQLIDATLRNHGVAHFLFHPAHIEKPNVADTLCGLVDYGRSRGLEWWTCQQIHQWETTRRTVQASFNPDQSLVLHAPQPIHEVTLLLSGTEGERPSVSVNGQSAATDSWHVLGFDFEAVTVNLDENTVVRVS